MVVLGEPDGPGHLAARRRFGRNARTVHVDSVDEAVSAVTERRGDLAVVPYESRVDGPVRRRWTLVESELKIVGCYEAPSALALVAKGAAAPLARIFGAAADLAAARRTLGKHEPAAALVESASARAACEAAREDASFAALAPEAVAVDHGLVVRRPSMKDTPDDRTRFAVLGLRPSARTGKDRTALLLGVKDAPGALHEVLHLFAERGLNLTNIHSRPSAGAEWRYLFFVEVEGHPTDRALVAALEDARRATRFLRVLGSYALD